MSAPSANPPSLFRRFLALAQAIGWTGGIVGLAVAAIGLNAIMWAVQFDPESSAGYWLRRKAGITPALGQVSPAQIKQKERLSAAELREALSPLPANELGALNREWLRAYLQNFQVLDSAVVLLRGNYVVTGARRLRSGEFMPGAAAFLAQSVEAPDVFIELIAPAPREGWNREVLRGLRGKVLTLNAENTSFAVIHVNSLPETPLLVTVVVAHSARLEGLSVREIDRPLAAPRRVHPAKLPVLDLELGDFLAARENAASEAPPFSESQNPIQFLAPGSNAELPPLPEPDLPKLSILLEAPAAPGPESDDPADANPAVPVGDDPALTPEEARPSVPTAAAAEKLAVQIQREMASWEAEDWPIYASGQMPRGRLLALPDAVRLRGYPLGGDPYYLVGDFVITAAGVNRCVMRLAEKGGQARFSAREAEAPRPVRFILDFPTGIHPPAAGRRLTRTQAEPLQLYRVENSPDGQLNVYLREVIAPSSSAPGVARR